MRAVDYFFNRDEILYYPSKSYSVAYIYATELSKYYGGSVIDYLNDPNLLYGNDDYYVTYNNDTYGCYDTLIREVGEYDTENGWVPETLKYFREECLGDFEYQHFYKLHT